MRIVHTYSRYCTFKIVTVHSKKVLSSGNEIMLDPKVRTRLHFYGYFHCIVNFECILLSNFVLEQSFVSEHILNNLALAWSLPF